MKVSREALEAELCRRDFYFFLKSFWDVIIPDEFKENWHIQYLCSELQKVGERVFNREEKEYDLIINVPPGTSKSTIVTIMFPVWCWVRDARLKIISASYSESLSTQHSIKSRDLLKSDKFQRLFPGLIEFKYDSDGKTLYENTKGGSRITTSVGGSVTGLHAHIICLDDLLNPKKAASEVERKNANDWIDNTISTRKVDKKITPTILVMQRLHETDCTGHILAKEGRVKHICLPAELSEDVQPEDLKEKYVDGLLDPVRLSREILEESKLNLGSLAYAGQFQQRPAPEEGGILKKEHFKVISRDEFLKMVPNPVFNSYIDPAYTAKKTNDPTALMSACIHNHCLYILDVEEVWKELPDLIKFIKVFAERNGHNHKSRVYVEPKASGLSVVQSLKESELNVIESESPKDDKVTRAHGIAPFIEAGKCHLVGSSETTWIKKFLDQCTMFPFAAHDDIVDTLIMAVMNVQSNKGGRTKFTFHKWNNSPKNFNAPQKGIRVSHFKLH
jgi:predicted phage terminase large subunit-like protein